MNIVYPYHNSLYINLTNRCTNACPYCIKTKWKGQFRGYDLILDTEPTVEKVIEAIKDPKDYHEIIFCGYGEPLIRLDEVKEISKWVKENGGTVRINTAGHANKFHGRNILPELKGLVDAISVSLNGSTPEEYMKINCPKYKLEAFDIVLDFVKEAKNYIPSVTITTVELPGLKVEPCKKIADRLGVLFRARPFLEENEI